MENTFWAAPTKQAAKSGVRIGLIAKRAGAKASPPRTKAKNITPVMKSVMGVIKAAKPHPNFLKMN